MSVNPPNAENVKINTAVLEGHVREVLDSAKTKLRDLNQDIDNLNHENDELSSML